MMEHDKDSTNNSPLHVELRSLIEALHHDTATREQVERLDLLVRTEPAAAEFLARYTHLLGDLNWLAGTVSPPDVKGNAISSAISASMSELNGLITRPIVWMLVVVAIVTGSLLTAQWFGGDTSREEMAKQPVTPDVPAQEPVVDKPFVSEHVATVTQLGDCRWPDDVGTPPRLRSRLAVGQALRPVAGLVEVTFDNGARVTLQGPAHAEIDSAKAVRLHLGRAFASIPPTAKGFQIETRGATWIDQGTDFGVAVDANGQALLQVNQGRVDVELGAAYSFKTLEITTGQAVRYDPQAFETTPVDFDARRFVTHVPTTELRTLDLVDIVAGGDGRSGRRGRGINPTTGRVELAPPQQYHRRGDGAYHRVPELPFIDGVFIADGEPGAVKLNSRGQSFAGFPDTDNRGYGYIWAGGEVPGGQRPNERLNTRIGDVDYSVAGRGVLSLHANHAITFDLAAIRAAYPQVVPTRFRSVAGNTGKVIPEEKLTADFWVFVDGSLLVSRSNISKSDGAFTLDIPLASDAQFLTLVATDGGKTIDDDWIMFGDPRLELAPATHNAVSRATESSPTSTR